MDAELPPETETTVKDAGADIRKYLRCLRAYARLYAVILGCLIVLMIAFYAVKRPVYTATALIGPQPPSPTSALYSSMSQSIGGGIASKLMGGNSASSFFASFQQMLTSNRLTNDLIYKDKILKDIFPKKFPHGLSSKQSAPGPFMIAINGIKHFLNRPTGYSKAPLMVQRYLSRKFSITDSAPPSGSIIGAFSANTNRYLSLSIKARSPESAEHLLNTILNRADGNIRHDQLRDINARIAYIDEKLKHEMSADQRKMLIDIQSNQEQIRMMSVADQRFSYAMISPPYASRQPSSPAPFSQSGIRCIILALVLWMALVGWSMKSEKMRHRLRRFYHPRMARPDAEA